MNKRSKTILTIGFYLFLISTVFSYTILTDTFSGEIKSNYWASTNMPISIIVDVDGGSFSFDSYELVRDCLKKWQEVTTSYLSFTISGYSLADINYTSIIETGTEDYFSIYYPLSNNYHSDGDTRHEVIFDSDGEIISNIFRVDPTNVLGVGIPFTDESTGEIKDAVLIVNTSIDLSIPILKAAVVHELGHFIGIGHTGVTPNILADEILATMYYASFPNDDSLGYTLAADDIAALSTLYPANNIEDNFGAIEGSVKSATGDGIFGISVIAVNKSSGEAIGGLSGYLRGSSGSGEFQITGVPEGTYVLYAEPIDGSQNVSSLEGINIGGIFTSIETSFTSEFFNDVSLTRDTDNKVVISESATDITVTKGYTTKGVLVYEDSDNETNEVESIEGAYPTIPGGEGFVKATAPEASTGESLNSGSCSVSGGKNKGLMLIFLLIVLVGYRKKAQRTKSK